MSEKIDSSNSISQAYLTKVLDQHGFGFQYAVTKIIRDLATDRWSWTLDGVEVPVEVRGVPTHIDILLKHANQPMYLVAECKRANPSLSNWCFLKAPYSTSWQTETGILVEVINYFDGHRLMGGMQRISSSGMVYHLPIELRTLKEGDPQGAKGRGAIDDAATQVLRHLNGFVELIARAMPSLGEFKKAFIMPVIFTTARLFTSDINLADSNPLTGKTDQQGSSMREVPWLYYQYNQSPGLKHGVPSQHKIGRLDEFVATEFSRTIAIVSASGIEGFLQESAQLL